MSIMLSKLIDLNNAWQLSLHDYGLVDTSSFLLNCMYSSLPKIAIGYCNLGELQRSSE